MSSTEIRTEDEPLLGRPGDASQKPEQGFGTNLVLGTAGIAQAGIFLLTISVWVAVFSNALVPLFSPHPLLNSAGLLLISQGILLLQPTHTPRQKIIGANLHAVVNGTGAACLLAAFGVIEANKFVNGLAHLYSPHAIMGLVLYILILLQTAVGLTQYYTPGLYGGVASAKKLYKYHRVSGYLLLVFALATVCTATQTDFVKKSIKLDLWIVLATSLITLVGLLPRIKLQKLGVKKQ